MLFGAISDDAEDAPGTSTNGELRVCTLYEIDTERAAGSVKTCLASLRDRGFLS